MGPFRIAQPLLLQLALLFALCLPALASSALRRSAHHDAPQGQAGGGDERLELLAEPMSAAAAREALARRGLDSTVEHEVQLEVQKELRAEESRLVRKVALAVEAEVHFEDAARLSSQERVSRAGFRFMEAPSWPIEREIAAVVVLGLLVGAVARLMWLLKGDGEEDSESASSALALAPPTAAANAAGGALVAAEDAAEQPFRIPPGVPAACACCLAFVPLGVFAQSLGMSPAATFWMNLLAIVPESFLICIATEELALHLGDSAGALLNATFGNAVEIIFVFLTLREGLLDACAGAIVGSILSNQLVLLGLALLLGGTLSKGDSHRADHGHLSFDTSMALEQAQQLLVASFSVTLPTTFARMQSVTPQHVLVLTRAFSVFLMLSYAALLIGQLRGGKKVHQEESHRAVLSAGDALALLAAATAAVSLSSKCLVDSLQEFCTGLGLSYGFVGMVMLPVAGDFSHCSAVYLAMKGKMDLAINISLASATQNALVIAPFSVLLGHFLGKPMTLGLQPIYGMVLLISAGITFAVLVDGRASWFRGYTLLTTYALVCLVIFFAPDVASPTH